MIDDLIQSHESGSKKTFADVRSGRSVVEVIVAMRRSHTNDNCRINFPLEREA